MKDDFGYFGSGLEGYVQYSEAFKRSFDSTSPPDRIPEDSISDIEPEDEDSTEGNSDMNIADQDDERR